MSHQTIFTIVLTVSDSAQAALNKLLIELNYRGCAPQEDPLGFQSVTRLHYASLFLYNDPDDGWLLIFENNIDGDVTPYINEWITTAINEKKTTTLLDIFNKCHGFSAGTIDQLADYLIPKVTLPAAGYSGCVGRSKHQIFFEAKLYDFISETLDKLPQNSTATAAAKAVHNAITNNPEFIDITNIPPDTPDGAALLAAQSLATNPEKEPTTFESIKSIGGGILNALRTAHREDGIDPVLKALKAAFIFLGLGVWNVIRKEPSAEEDQWRPDPAHVRSQKAFEDFYPTNHMVSVVHPYTDGSRIKAKKAAFELLQLLAKYENRFGKLGDIPTIHFAHWALLNNDKRLLFVSNFDGSWDSYLDDFTLKAAAGLTLAWAHCIGFPKSAFMILDGAAKGPEFIDWARRSMVPTLVWFNAYPELSIRNINRNTALRQAIVKDTEQNNSTHWLEII